ESCDWNMSGSMLSESMPWALGSIWDMGLFNKCVKELRSFFVENHWKKIKSKISNSGKLNEFQGIAVVVYTGDIGPDLNTAIREFNNNISGFRFKALHYYLTTALQLLYEKNTYTVYRGTSTWFNYPGKGNARFGQFASSSQSREIAVNFIKGTGTLFTIQTSLGVDISKFSLIPKEKEVLIPGYEEYQDITELQKTQGFNEISLKSPRKSNSKFNCRYIFNSSGESTSVFQVGELGSSSNRRGLALLPEATRTENNRVLN
ncbi:T-cell ecto-ADP-ribosyltransferase 1, partial [Galemys pyrenaicus]